MSHAALIGRIGHDGPPFAVRSSKELTADRSGYLYLMVNDHPAWFGDNPGSVTARVRMLGAPPARGGGAGRAELRGPRPVLPGHPRLLR